MKSQRILATIHLHKAPIASPLSIYDHEVPSQNGYFHVPTIKKYIVRRSLTATIASGASSYSISYAPWFEKLINDAKAPTNSRAPLFQ